MLMRDWELIANVHGDEWRELKWIEAYMVENGCDRVFVQEILSFPDFNLAKLGEYISTLFMRAASDTERNWLADNYMDMLTLIEPCADEFYRLLDNPIIGLVNGLARINWHLFLKWKLHYTFWSVDNNRDGSGRAWIAGSRTLTYWKFNSKNEPTQDVWALHGSWTIPKWDSFGFSINVGGIENVVTFHVGLLLFSAFLSIEKLPHHWVSWLSEGERELSFRIHHGIIWIYLFAKVDCWRNNDWRRVVINPVDLLLGWERCATQVEGERPVDIHFDNRIYKANAKLEIRTWTRSRFPFLKRTRKDVGLEIASGIPMPGKGENSYDCGDDALFGTGASTTNLDTSWDDLVAEAIDNATSSVQRTRLRYGGDNWESFAQQVARETGLEIIDN